MPRILQQTWRCTWTALATSSSVTPVLVSSIVWGVQRLQWCDVHAPGHGGAGGHLGRRPCRYRTTSSVHVHSSERSSPTSRAFKAFTTGSSYWSLCQICSMKMASSPSNVTASVALNSNTSGVSRVQSMLSSIHLDKASGLPICIPGLWVRAKSNLERYRDHRAWQRCRREIEITRDEIYSTHTTKKAGYVVERDRPRYI